MRVANILDEIHAELSPLVFDNPADPEPKIKAVHRQWLLKTIYKTLEDAGYEGMEEWLSLVFTGSLTTYQYSDDSDVDISLFVDVDHFPEWSRAEMIGLMIDKMDGTTMPGTPHPLQCFVVPPELHRKDLYQPGMRSGYDLDNETWIVPPERERIHDVQAEMSASYVYALQQADKMASLLKYEPDKAVMFWHMIHRRRRRDMMKGKGDYSDSNICYKMLANRGLFPVISEVSGEYIAGLARPMPGRTATELHIGLKLPKDVSKQIHTWVEDQDWPEGTELEDPSDYHITLVYAPDGHEDHAEDEWRHAEKGYDAEIVGLDLFGNEEKKAVVLKVKSPDVERHAEDVIEVAEDRGLEVSKFPGGYKPHITVAYATDKPNGSPLKLKFKTGPSSVSEPRTSNIEPEVPDHLNELKFVEQDGRKYWAEPEDLWHQDIIERHGLDPAQCQAGAKHYQGGIKYVNNNWDEVDGEWKFSAFPQISEINGELNGVSDEQVERWYENREGEGRPCISKIAAVPLHDPNNPQPIGMPRPIAPWGGQMKPVPWSQDSSITGKPSWGIIDYAAQSKATRGSLCLLCGERVDRGMVFVSDDQGKEVYGYADLDTGVIVDHGPLHERCAKITAIHCPHLKEGLQTGEYIIRPYVYTDKTSMTVGQALEFDVAAKAYQAVVNSGGITIRIDGVVPTVGYVFSPFKGLEEIIPVATLKEEDIDAFLLKNRQHLARPESYLGMWVSGLNVYIDVTQVIENFDLAYKLAWDADQIAMWDLAQGVEIPVREGGSTPLEIASNFRHDASWLAKVCAFAKTATVRTPPGALPWELGSPGKGIVVGGQSWVWSDYIGMSPEYIYHHDDILDMLDDQEAYQEGDFVNAMFWINPDGGIINAYNLDNGQEWSLQQVVQLDSRFKIPGDESWTFSKIAPAHSFVMSKGDRISAKPYSQPVVCKFVYSPLDNRLVVGDMAREEGEVEPHADLLRRSGLPVKNNVYGQFDQSGRVETFGRPKIEGFGKPAMNPKEADYRAKQALEATVPGIKFDTFVPSHDKWNLTEPPQVTYMREPPVIGGKLGEPESDEWTFAKIAAYIDTDYGFLNSDKIDEAAKGIEVHRAQNVNPNAQTAHRPVMWYATRDAKRVYVGQPGSIHQDLRDEFAHHFKPAEWDTTRTTPAGWTEYGVIDPHNFIHWYGEFPGEDSRGYDSYPQAQAIANALGVKPNRQADVPDACKTCGGSGMDPDETYYHTAVGGCPDCHGTGRVRSEENWTFGKVGSWVVDPRAVDKAATHLGLQHPVEVRVEGGTYGQYQGLQNGTHIIKAVEWLRPQTANEQIWHELVHAKQAENGVEFPARPDDYDAYRAQPHEQEAHDFEAPFSVILTL